MNVEQFEAYLAAGWWFLTDDGEDLCAGCAEANAARVLESLRAGRRDGWCVTAVVPDDAPDLCCCVCYRGTTENV